MRQIPEPTPPSQLLARLRQDIPKRALTYSESLTIAGLQALKLRVLLGVTTPAMPLGWVADLPRVTLEVVPAHQLKEGASGATTRKDGRYLVRINKNRPRVHRRFTLAHELKHVIDYPYSGFWHAGLGHGDQEVQSYRIEKLADTFAANLLMPTVLFKRAWASGIQKPRLLATVFEVSIDAAQIRSSQLGLTDDDEQPAATYFRRPNFDYLMRGM